MKTILCTFLALLLAGAAVAAPTVTSGTMTENKITIAGHTLRSERWKSNASGQVKATVAGVYGQIQRVTLISDTGTSAPTTAYDVTVKDSDDFDLLRGKGGNVPVPGDNVTFPCMLADNLSSSQSIPVVVMSRITVEILNAGAAKAGYVKMIFKP